MNQQTLFSDLENEYKLSGTKSVSYLKLPKMSLFLSLGLSKKLKKEKRKKTMIEQFKEELKDFKNILDKINELELLREQEINETKRKLNVLDDEIRDTLEKLDVNLTTVEWRSRSCKKLNDFEKERELRLLAK